jgi:hypothetical protein
VIGLSVRLRIAGEAGKWARPPGRVNDRVRFGGEVGSDVAKIGSLSACSAAVKIGSRGVVASPSKTLAAKVRNLSLNAKLFGADAKMLGVCGIV